MKLLIYNYIYMNINDLKEKPIWQMTGEEFIFLAH